MKIKHRKFTTPLAALAVAVVITACGTNTHEEIKVIGGYKSVCTWTESEFNPTGEKQDYICQAIPVGAPATGETP